MHFGLGVGITGWVGCESFVSEWDDEWDMASSQGIDELFWKWRVCRVQLARRCLSSVVDIQSSRPFVCAPRNL